jgi:S-methylmethionine-dependent homocysteine/selenocysteine methylase
MLADRANLPQLEHRPFLTDSGLETTLIFKEGIDLPSFAAFVLLETPDGRRRLRRYFERHAQIARAADCGFIAEAPTWRANPDWARELGYDGPALAAINRSAITLLTDLRDRDGRGRDDYVISGCIGPRGDGYDASREISADEAEHYHAEQIASFALTQADLVSALTLTNTAEAIGITRAARKAGMPIPTSSRASTPRLSQAFPSSPSSVDAAARTSATSIRLRACASPRAARTEIAPLEGVVTRCGPLPGRSGTRGQPPAPGRGARACAGSAPRGS